MKGIDVSSYQSPDLTNLIAIYEPEVIVVKLYLPVENISQTHTIAQVRSALLNNCRVSGYAWAYGSVSAEKTVAWAATLADYAGASIRGEFPAARLWLDFEDKSDPPDAMWLVQAINKAQDLGISLGIYTGYYWWRNHIGLVDFSFLPLWLADYDGDPTLTSRNIPFGGWTYLTGKQWTSTPIDQNTFEDTMARTPEQQRIIDVLRVNTNSRLEQLKAAASWYGYDKFSGEINTAITEVNGEVDKLETMWPNA